MTNLVGINPNSACVLISRPKLRVFGGSQVFENTISHDIVNRRFSPYAIQHPNPTGKLLLHMAQYLAPQGSTPMITPSVLAVVLALAVLATPAVAQQQTDFPTRDDMAKCDKAHPIKVVQWWSQPLESCVLRETARFKWSQGLLPTWCAAGKPATFYQGWVTSCTMARDWEFAEEPGMLKKTPCKAGRVAVISKDRLRLDSCK
jgi:hypothetical protein